MPPKKLNLLQHCQNQVAQLGSQINKHASTFAKTWSTYTYHFCHGQVCARFKNLSICTMFKKFAENWNASHELDVHIKEKKKFTTQKIEDADGANNRILNSLMFVLFNRIRDPNITRSSSFKSKNNCWRAFTSAGDKLQKC